jgi:fructokinase
VQVVDTVGAGDAFGGAFLAWWSGRELTRSDLHREDAVREALCAAVEVASFTCTRAGADPPWLAEVAGKAGWHSGPRARQQLPLP